MRNAYYIRLDRGETLGEVARATGLDEGTIRDLERGERSPQTATVKRIADHYGVTARELLSVDPVETGSRAALEVPFR